MPAQWASLIGPRLRRLSLLLTRKARKRHRCLAHQGPLRGSRPGVPANLLRVTVRRRKRHRGRPGHRGASKHQRQYRELPSHSGILSLGLVWILITPAMSGQQTAESASRKEEAGVEIDVGGTAWLRFTTPFRDMFLSTLRRCGAGRCSAICSDRVNRHFRFSSLGFVQGFSVASQSNLGAPWAPYGRILTCITAPCRRRACHSSRGRISLDFACFQSLPTLPQNCFERPPKL